MAQPPRAPAGLARPGATLWKKIVAEHTLSVWELEILEGACRTKDLVTVLDGDIATSELKTMGSMDQEVLNDSIKERRMQESHLIKLLTQLRLPDAQQLAGTSHSKTRVAAGAHARKAARTRWG